MHVLNFILDENHSLKVAGGLLFACMLMVIITITVFRSKISRRCCNNRKHNDEINEIDNAIMMLVMHVLNFILDENRILKVAGGLLFACIFIVMIMMVRGRYCADAATTKNTILRLRMKSCMAKYATLMRYIANIQPHRLNETYHRYYRETQLSRTTVQCHRNNQP